MFEKGPEVSRRRRAREGGLGGWSRVRRGQDESEGTGDQVSGSFNVNAAGSQERVLNRGVSGKISTYSWEFWNEIRVFM